MKEEEEQSAFPALHLDGHRGMSLRDYFAAKAMEGHLSNPYTYNDPDIVAESAYEVADAMLKRREL
jgi:hypothetical protein